MRSFASAAIAASGLISMAAATITDPIDPLIIKGSKFYYKSNETQL